MASQTVAVVDYGMGNLRSVAQALHAAAQGLNCRIVVTSDPKTVVSAERVVLPGQGAMPQCMAQLQASGLYEAVMDASARKPLFGVCVGMQMLLDESAEGDTPSLGLIPGKVVKFDLAGQKQPDGSAYKVPQMGWNRVHQKQSHVLWNGIPPGSYFYFVHSYYAQPEHESNTVGETEYGGRFTSAIARDNIFATQFHPEKSAEYGLALYRNFLAWKP